MRQYLILLLSISFAIAEVPEIDKETRARLGIVTEDLAETELAPGVSGFATVLDPAPLVALLRQEKAAAATIGFSQKSLERAENLFNEGKLVPQKTVDAARAQLLADEAARQTIADSITAGYGKLSSSEINADALLAAETILLRISTHASPDVEPVSAIISSKPPVTASGLTRAPVADPVFQNVSWLAVAEGKGLVPGMTVPARLTLPGEPEKGHLLPAAAIVWHLGIPWAFHEEGEGKFERVRVPGERKTEGGQFISLSSEGFPTTGIVTTGAAPLLSTEISTPLEDD